MGYRKFKILKGRKNTKSMILTPDLRQADLGLYRDQLGRTSWVIVLGKRRIQERLLITSSILKIGGPS